MGKKETFEGLFLGRSVLWDVFIPTFKWIATTTKTPIVCMAWQVLDLANLPTFLKIIPFYCAGKWFIHRVFRIAMLKFRM
jgi:hypothetical protein